MNNSNLVNSIGLVCDIVGALLVWRFGLPEPISRSGAINIICEQADESEVAQAKRFDRFAGCGISLIVGGFVLQLVSNFL